MSRAHLRCWQRALIALLLLLVSVAPLIASPGPGGSALANAPAGQPDQAVGQNAEPPAQIALQDSVLPVDSLAENDQPSARASAVPPVPPPAHDSRIDGTYVPSGIPYGELPPDGRLIRLNVRLEPQDMDVAALRLESALRTSDQHRLQTGVSLAQPSAEIQALAAGLDNDPQLIYEYVRNHYDFVPTWGLSKSPRETYLAKAGNAFDLCALLVALLRAAGYEAEFAFGQIRISPEQLEAWVGASDMMAALWVLLNGGIPAEMVISGFAVEHVWVRAKVSGTWHPLDASFKAYNTQPGMNLTTVLGYDRSAFLSAAQSGSTIQADYARSINEANINGRLAQYGANLASHLRANHAFAYLSDVIGGRVIVPETTVDLPTQVPYTVLQHRGTAQEIPGALVHRLRIQLPGIDYRTDLPDVAGERITIFYEPATAADQAKIDAAGSIYDVYPAHQVNMKPKLRVGGTVVATGQAVSLGSSQQLDVSVATPIDDGAGSPVLLRYAPQNLRAGQWYALPMKLQTVSEHQLRRHETTLRENLASGLDESSEPVLGQALFTMGMAYLHQTNLSDQLTAQVAGVIRIPFVSGMLVSQDIAVLEWEQIGGQAKARRIGQASYSVDVRLEFLGAVSATGDSDQERGFSIVSGHHGSATEHAILEQLQGHPAISTVQVLDLANQQSISIYHITSANLNSVLPLLSYSSEIKQMLQDEVEAGREISIPKRSITYNEWTGTGWVGLEPNSGSTGYFILGGMDGSQAAISTASLQQGGAVTLRNLVDIIKLLRSMHNGIMIGVGCAEGDCNVPNNVNNSNDPVDTVTGSFIYATTDVEFGAIGIPINFSRVYVSSRHLNQSPIGFAWAHSYNSSLVESSDWARALGYRTAMDAAEAVAEAHVSVDIASTPSGGLPHQNLIIGTETADRMLARMTGNVITISGPDGTRYEYLLLSDGSYLPPVGTYATLLNNGDGTYTIVGKGDEELDFRNDGKMWRMVDAYGNQTTLHYDSGGMLIRVSDAVGRNINLTYSAGLLAQVRAPTGRVYRYEYDSAGNLVRYIDARGGTTIYAYDNQHRITSITDPEGNVIITNAYDEWGRVVSQTNYIGGVSTYLYGDVRTTVIDPLNRVTVFHFDGRRRLTTTEDDRGYETRRELDAHGNTISITDGNDRTHQFTYDSRGNLLSHTNPLGAEISYTYEADDNLIAAADPRNSVSSLTYDGHHGVTSFTDPLGNTTQYAYSQTGQLVHITDANGHTTTLTYNSRGDLIGLTGPLGNTFRMGRDVLGLLTSVENPQGDSVQFTRDANGNVVSLVDALGNQTTYSYDLNDHLLSETDARGNSTTYTYLSSLPISATDAAGFVTSYEFNANCELAAITDGRGNRVSMETDAMGRITTFTDALGRVSEYAFDGDGNLVQRLKPDGTTLEFQYDGANHLTRIRSGSQDVLRLDYDLAGNMIAAFWDDQSAHYEHDAAGRLSRVSYSLSPYSVDYTYDPVGNRTSRAIVSGEQELFEIEYGYDAGDQLVDLTYGESREQIQLAYDDTGNLTSIHYADGTRSNYTYDANGNVSSLQVLDSHHNVVTSIDYSYDAVGNTTSMVENTPGGTHTTSYEYDARNQLLSEVYPRYSVDYSYDAVGNRTSMVSPLGSVAYTYDAANQMLSAGATSFVYDLNGNQTSKTDSRGTWGYAYDVFDRLTSLSNPAGAVHTMAYDHLGRLYRVSGPAGTKRLLSEASRVILEETEIPGERYGYVHAGSQLITRYSLWDAPSAASLHYHGDALGSIVALTSEPGLPVGGYGYDAFGYGRAPSAIEENAYRFVGQAGVRSFDGVEGLYLMGLRYYDASTGRFLTRDPVPGYLLQPATHHPYVYAMGNPLRYYDPLGLKFYGSAVHEELDRILEEEDPNFVVITAANVKAATRWLGHLNQYDPNKHYYQARAEAREIYNEAKAWESFGSWVPGYRPIVTVADDGVRVATDRDISWLDNFKNLVVNKVTDKFAGKWMRRATEKTFNTIQSLWTLIMDPGKDPVSFWSRVKRAFSQISK